MSKKFTKIVAILLVMTMVFSIGAAAVTVSPNLVEPRYVGISSTTASLEFSSSLATCTGNAVARSGYRVEMRLGLQRSTNSTTWSTITSWTGSGTGIQKLTQSYYVLSGYYYRSTLTVSVYNSSGKVIETITTNSDSQYH